MTNDQRAIEALRRLWPIIEGCTHNVGVNRRARWTFE